MNDSDPAAAVPGGDLSLTPHVQIRTVQAVVNPAAGSVSASSAAELERIVSSFGLQVTVTEITGGAIVKAVEAAVAAKPDLLIVLAGDGTARLAAERAGPDGPLVAPLPGGTMNMLPKALYGDRNWQDALQAALSEGQERCVSGGQIQGHSFYVAAILGAPALWADAREAVRQLKIIEAFNRAQRAFKRALTGELSFEIDGGRRCKSEALTLLCPLVSAAVEDDDALEAAALDPHTLGEAVRLTLRTAFGQVLGDWRKDPAVTIYRCKTGRAMARGRIPAILDGEPQRFDGSVSFRFLPKAFRALVPVPRPPEAEDAPTIL